MKNALRWASAWICCTLIWVLPRTLWAAESAHSAGAAGRLGAPPALQAPAEPAPHVDGEEHAARAWSFSAWGELQGKACAAWAEPCTEARGFGVGLLALARPWPHFAWGFSAGASHLHENFERAGWDVQVRTRAWSGALAGRFYFLESGRLSPFVQWSTGLGSVAEEVTLSAGTRQGVAAHERAWVPLYSASFGSTWQVTGPLHIGAQVTWTHWLTQPWQRCPVLLGVCTVPHPGGFDPNNAVLSAGLNVGLSLGDKL